MSEQQWGDIQGLRFSAESLADAIKARIGIQNRVRSGRVDVIGGTQLIARAQEFEDAYRDQLTSVYTEVVPLKIRAWASTQPIIRSGETFPRIIGLIGDPHWAIPLRAEGTGKDRKLVPNGKEHARDVRELWRICGCGSPNDTPQAVKDAPDGEKQAALLRMGKRTTVRPLLYSFSSQLVMNGTPVTKEGSKFFGRPRSLDCAESDYFRLYMKIREEAAGNVHAKPCKNHKRPPAKSNGCGTAAHPERGEIGSPWLPGHVQAHAHRLLQKQFLADLWEVAGTV
jgi:hypothetical protein